MPINEKRLNLSLMLLLGSLLLSTQSFAGGASTTVFRFQQTMADKGLPQAQYKLGMMYETGSAVEQNMLQAKFWYGRAAFQNYKPARHRLTYLDIKQNGFTPQHEQWVRDLKQDAAHGNGEAMLLLGQMYEDGIALQRDLDKSITVLRKASAANVPGSEAELLRVENQLLAEQRAEQQRKQALAEQQQAKAERQKQIEQQRRAEQLKQQKLQEQRLRREQQERERQRQLIAERERQQRLQAIRAEQERQRRIASQKALEAALREPMLVTETDTSDVCSGSNRFSATCR